jgi:hypothetical protein
MLMRMLTGDLKNGLTSKDLFDQFCDLLDKKDPSSTDDFIQYQADPAGFGQNVLKESYTEEVKALMRYTRVLNPVCPAAMLACSSCSIREQRWVPHTACSGMAEQTFSTYLHLTIRM